MDTTTTNGLEGASAGNSIPSRAEMLGWFVTHPSMYRECGRMTRNRIARARVAKRGARAVAAEVRRSKARR